MAGRVILSAAGAGKTEHLLRSALGRASDTRVLLTTFTNRNQSQIVNRISDATGGQIPKNVDVLNWCNFLLQHCVYPYQSHVLWPGAIRGFSDNEPVKPDGKDPRRNISRSDILRYHLDPKRRAYTERLSDLACIIQEQSKGLVVKRLESIYGLVLVDEVQDMAGYDLILLELLMSSSISLELVGDPRQATYATNRSAKNASYRGSQIVNWVASLAKKNLCSIEKLDKSWRCHQSICDFADALYPDADPTIGADYPGVEDLGVHLVKLDDVPAYIERFSPQALRYDRRTSTPGMSAMNYGESKGCGFDRVLIFPTKTILKYLASGDPGVVGSIEKFYVAVTRARYSVGFVINGKIKNVTRAQQWNPVAG